MTAVRKTCQVNHFRDTGYNSWKLDELMDQLARWKIEIPVEYHNTIRFVVDSEDQQYSDNQTTVCLLTYERPETDAEFVERVGTEAAAQTKRDESERVIYERLKAKFEGGK